MNISKSRFAMLPPLFALLKHKNVTYAAEQLHISQSAMSKILAQLRDSFDDDLLVRTGKQYRLTQRGESLLLELESLMPQAEKLWQAPILDLANETRFINIAGTDMDVDYIAARLDNILLQAPNAGVSVTNSDEQSLTALKEGELDFVMSAFDLQREYLERALLLESDYVVVANKSLTVEHMDIDTYLSFPHVAFQLAGQFSGQRAGAKKSAVDIRLAQLSQQNRQRKIALWTPTFYHAIKTVATSPKHCLLTMPRLFAERSTFVNQLTFYSLPLGLAPIKVYLYWHKKVNSDPFLSWVRDELKLLRT